MTVGWEVLKEDVPILTHPRRFEFCHIQGCLDYHLWTYFVPLDQTSDFS